MTTNPTALVTGASGDLGQAIARRLAAQGFDLLLHYHQNRVGAVALAEELEKNGTKVRLLCLDLSDGPATQKALEEDLERFGAPWAVVHNAGIVRDSSFPAMAAQDWEQVIGTNLNSFYYLLQPLVLPMVKLRSGGRILVVSSLAGIRGHQGQTNYAASKAGLIAAAKSLSLELASRKITVNCIAPGLIESKMTQGLEALIPQIPLGRMGTAEEVANLAGFLCSPGAGYITGQVIQIDGGLG
ncbi:MAG: 3-oxoacyl-ACP reductase [Candidatus Lambdaproteobacteria bacterium RIFOXYD1_FULL_56_27]|uniref:3-oxoacyl-ACP reductase n=1 Tax=Candidatus Lambdaproteobacteria bacterium RIFOXYD2_FULL_56_26 TaxID=1817773 RepID=A0A1F6GMX6_9PROT|nr:MAG: 3-oxoacyl-ACP reductase [Candidatus Lambdaproteobacteria bacterium RIFOXYD2_FULL_56_26]OGH05540.1 MAG: 3-oxoacyl-ACP reductase [Candidatus Lambdaproteobacteria bacterium RIFOXYC1_FULL_56_13]OGH08499.1 MAG: 3-oxoacyl-ACP reductase [Candidatus Lambdaproteobacteria bacterium RIFOXYD1_FULL_56_27]